MRLCKRYSDSGRRCKVGDASEKYVEYMQSAVPCDLAISPAKLRRIHQERIRLRKEVQKARSKYLRLEKQLEFVEKEEKDLVAAEWQNISELELEERAVQAAASGEVLFNISSEQF